MPAVPLGVGQAPLAAAGRFVEQQSEELPLSQPQQEHARQQEQQHRFSCRLRLLVHSSKSAMAGQNRQVGIWRAYLEESSPAPVISLAVSKNKLGAISLVSIAEELMAPT